MNDDFNTAKVLANMFEVVPIINSLKDGSVKTGAIAETTFRLLKEKFTAFVEDIFGLDLHQHQNDKLEPVMDLLLEIRKEARDKKDFVLSDKIRNRLSDAGLVVKDERGGGMSWGAG